MNAPAHKFHEQWLGMVQPSEGLVVSIPVLVDAQCMQKQERAVQERLLACTARDLNGRRYAPNLVLLFSEVLGLGPERWDTPETLPKALRLYVPEGRQELRPSFGLKRAGGAGDSAPQSASKGHSEPPPSVDLAAAASAGQSYLALVWDVPSEVDLDKPETVTGPWDYPAQAKFDRLLRECRVPIGILSNGRELRLTYAPHGESSGWLSFRIDAMCEVGGRPILDALVMLLGQERLFAVAQDVQLPSLLAQSRGKQGEVTNALARQLFEALEELLAGFSAAADRDRLQLLRRALEEGEEGYVYSGLLTVLLRLVFALYCEDRGLLPVEHELFAQNYSLFGLYDQLEKDHGRYPDSMDRRFGAYPRLLSLFRAMYLGVSHGASEGRRALHLPPRHGDLFNPQLYPFLEGWSGGSAPIVDPELRAQVEVPAISDGTVYRVLKKLIVLGGQRLSYRALDVEQIGSVYEALMGFDVERIVGSSDAFVGGRTQLGPSARPAASTADSLNPGVSALAGAIRIKLSSKKGAARVWLQAEPLLALPAARRAKWLQDELGFDKAVAAKITEATKSAKSPAEALSALEPLSGKNPERAAPGALVIQPGPERRRTSSHYTPRSLSEPIVRKTLDPLIACLGEAPSSQALLSLKVCDPAMGSGAFLVAACRYLADHVVAAWTREASASANEPPDVRAANEAAPAPPGSKSLCDPPERSRFLGDEGRIHFDRQGVFCKRPPIDDTPVTEASTPAGKRSTWDVISDTQDDVVNHARRLVAQRCLYGVDKNKYAVQLARLSLWLVTMAKHEPFTFVDHALRHGDSLVGLNFEQIRAFHWQAGHKGEQINTTARALQEALDEAIGIRQQILDLAADPSPEAQREKEGLLRDADDALNNVRLIADLVVGAFFACDKDKDREKERTRRLDLVQRWLSENDLGKQDELKAELSSLRSTLLDTQVPFHWHLEFPEVFYMERPDPLDGGKINGAAMMDAFVGNPPFMGGSAISSNFGDGYRDWLLAVHEPAHGNADLSAHFYRRPALLIGSHGTIGLIATNTIGQGDTRSTGLQHLVRNGFQIFGATVNMSWPGDAAVTVSVVHLAKGNPAKENRAEFDGSRVDAINSRLRPKPERPDPTALATNAQQSFLGSKIYGQGFTLTPDERDALIKKNPSNAERIFPYLGGEEVNTSPTQSHNRYVISFGQMELEEAEKWPDLIEIVRDKVKPERDKLKDNADGRRRKAFWWQFGRLVPALDAAIAPLDRCLVIPQQFTNVVRATFQPTHRIFSQKAIVVAVDSFTSFVVIQSAVHDTWARLLGGRMGSANTPVYSPSDSFETFPFPAEDPRAVLPELETLGEQLYEARAKYMVATDQGLTKTYNALKDPNCSDPRILALRAMHEEMDRAVLRAYPRLPGMARFRAAPASGAASSSAPASGNAPSSSAGPASSTAPADWSDIVVPPFCIATEEDKAALQAFEDEVIDRLFILNEDRAKKEQALGRGAKKGAKGKAAGSKTPKAGASAGTKKGQAAQNSTATDSGVSELGASEAGLAPKGKARTKKGAPPEGQGSLF